ncbi:MAG: NusG domain II-containing protein [Vicinamibacterales bacterium]|nr:NusG domain II-containing protein [Vicinamibacterales bacterium]
MTTRRQFLNRTLVGGAAFGLGLWHGLGPSNRDGGWNLSARVPDGEEPGLEALAAAFGLDVSGGRWQPAGSGTAADLVLVRDGRLLDPAEWPAAATRLRGRWAGREAARWYQWTAACDSPARRARVVGHAGSLATLDLDHEGDRAFRGRDGRRMVVSVSNGRVEVAEASCRHRHCQRQGRVSLAGERLVCAPAGLIVQLEV